MRSSTAATGAGSGDLAAATAPATSEAAAQPPQLAAGEASAQDVGDVVHLEHVNLEVSYCAVASIGCLGRCCFFAGALASLPQCRLWLAAWQLHLYLVFAPHSQQVPDLDLARVFYGEGLGLTPDPDSLGWQRGGPFVTW